MVRLLNKLNPPFKEMLPCLSFIQKMEDDGVPGPVDITDNSELLLTVHTVSTVTHH